jgi:hypothetical protein
MDLGSVLHAGMLEKTTSFLEHFDRNKDSFIFSELQLHAATGIRD